MSKNNEEAYEVWVQKQDNSSYILDVIISRSIDFHKFDFSYMTVIGVGAEYGLSLAPIPLGGQNPLGEVRNWDSDTMLNTYSIRGLIDKEEFDDIWIAVVEDVKVALYKGVKPGEDPIADSFTIVAKFQELLRTYF